MYSIDTNIYLDWWVRRYPEDVFPIVRAGIEGLVANGRWNAVQRVADEIVHVGTPQLKSWAIANKAHFHKHDARLVAEAGAISRGFPGMIDPYARHDEADRYVIALAKLKNWIVVTHETPAGTKKNPPRTLYIPDVCSALNIQCIGLLELMRLEKWVFK